MATSILGKELIVESTRKMVHVLTDIGEHEDPWVDQSLKRLDIHASVCVIESLMELIEHAIHGNNKTVAMCLQNLHDIICQIEKELAMIHQLLPCHKEKWFHLFRVPDYEKNIQNLRECKQIMDKRLDLLIKVLSIPVHK